MKQFCKLIACITCITPAISHADGFGWYANAVDREFFENLMGGGLDGDLAKLDAHLMMVIQYDMEDENFPYDASEVKSMLREIAESGISLEVKDDEGHENQWYAIDAVVAPPVFYDHQYQKSNIQAIGDEYLSPRSLVRVLGRDEFASSLLHIFLGVDELGPRFESGSCLKNIKFGICIYSYIFLDWQEVQDIHDELKKNWRQYNSRDIDNLKQIFHAAASSNRPLIFHGQD